MTLSDIGGWNLDIQHKYNYHEGILQKGDGTNLYLKYTPLVVTNVVGKWFIFWDSWRFYLTSCVYAINNHQTFLKKSCVLSV